MKQPSRRLVQAVLVSLGTVGAAAGRIPFAIGEWPPYTSERLEGYGFMSKIASAVAREMGMTADFSFQPWLRCEDKIRRGEAFATFPYTITRGRKREFAFAVPVMPTRHLFFYNNRIMKDEPPFDSLNDLKSFKIGGVRGNFYTESFGRAGLITEYVPEDEQNVMKLHAGRIDLAIMDSVLGWTLIRKLYPDQVEQFSTLSRPLRVGEMSFMISRAYPGAEQLRLHMNKALLRMAERGEIAAMIKPYLPRPDAGPGKRPLQRADD